jgi:phosphoglycerate dehydrogenase-like enzyme
MRFRLVMLPPQSESSRALVRRIVDSVPEATVVVAETPDDTKREIATADAAYGTLPAEILSCAGRLRWLQCPQAAPPAGYYHPDLVAHPVIVTNLRGIFADRVPAHIMAYLLAFARGLHTYMDRQREHLWDSDHPAPVVHLPDSIALIVGVGSIGAAAARLCSAFGMRVVGVDPRQTQLPEGLRELYPPDQLDRLLPIADFVILTMPHTPKTEGLFDAVHFRLMKKSAFFINVGRGMTTKLDDLNRALRDGNIAGAGLDVYEIEPLPNDHPLWTAPNILLTPHVAADGPDLEPARQALIVENARRFAAGEPLVNVVDKREWY